MKRKHNEFLQLTIRGVPSKVKESLRDRADKQGKSLNTMLVEALSAAAGFSRHDAVYDDLDDLAGCWKDDAEFDKAIADQNQIDHSLWQ